MKQIMHKAAQGHGSNATQSHWMTSTILSGGNQTQAMSFWRQHMHPAGPRTYQSGNMCPQQFQTVIPVSIMGCPNKCECAKQQLPMMDIAQSTHKHCLLNSGAIIRPQLSAASSQCEQLGNCSHQPCTHLALYKPRPPDKHKSNPYRPSREHETNHA